MDKLTFYNEIQQNFTATNVLSLDPQILELYQKIQLWMQDKIRAESLIRGWDRFTVFHMFYTVENPDDFSIWRNPKDLKIGYKYNKSKESFTEIYNVKEFAKVNFIYNFYNYVKTVFIGFTIKFNKVNMPNASGYKQDGLPIYYVGSLHIEY